MSDAEKGHSRERAIERLLNALGYRTVLAAKSGQRRGAERQEGAFPCDVVGFAPCDSSWPHVVVEVGGPKKSAKAALAEMLTEPLMGGFVAIVARQVRSRPRVRWRWHLSSDEGFDSLAELLDAVRER